MDLLHASKAVHITPMEELALTDDTQLCFWVMLELSHINHHLPHWCDAYIPPHPLLNPDLTPTTSEATSIIKLSMAKEKTSQGGLAPSLSSVAAAAIDKQCGCPPGSMNKPKNKWFLLVSLSYVSTCLHLDGVHSPCPVSTLESYSFCFTQTIIHLHSATMCAHE